MSRKWVTNASPLILLGKIGRIVWLKSLSKELVIPDGVAVEVRAGIESDAAANWIANSGSNYIREIGKKDIETVKKKGSIRDTWSVGITKKINQGDRVFRMKLGEIPRGIIASLPQLPHDDTQKKTSVYD